MRRNVILAVVACALMLALMLSASSANAGHLGVRVWVLEPKVHDLDPLTGSQNALRSDGKGTYVETTDTYAHVNDWAPTTSYEDHFLFIDRKGTKRTVRLNIPGVTPGTVTCGTKLQSGVYPFGNDHWFNDLVQDGSAFAYGYIACRITDSLIWDITYPESTWCLTISRLDSSAEDIGKAFRFSASETCMASVVKSVKTGRDTWTYTSYGPVSVPFDVDAVVTREIKTA